MNLVTVALPFYIAKVRNLCQTLRHFAASVYRTDFIAIAVLQKKRFLIGAVVAFQCPS